MSVVAMAAGVFFGGANLASAQDAQQRLQQEAQQTQQQIQQDRQKLQAAGQDASDQAGQAVQAGAQQQGQHQGQQVDQQLTRAFQQIQQSPEQAGDKLFVLCAAIDNQYEIQFSQQAMQKAQNPEVKKLAQMIVQDHQQASQQLQKVAQQMQLQVPQGLPSLKQQEIQVLSSLSSDQFDKQYVAKMHASHAMAVAAFGAQASLAQSQELKQFVTQALPKLQQHQQHVQRTAQAIGLTQHGGDAVQAGARERGNASETNETDTNKTDTNKTDINSPDSKSTDNNSPDQGK
jgi:putative membrane protein